MELSTINRTLKMCVENIKRSKEQWKSVVNLPGMNSCRLNPRGYWVWRSAEFSRNQPGLEAAWRIQAHKNAEEVVQAAYLTSATSRLGSKFLIHAREELVFLQSKPHSIRLSLNFLNLVSSRDLVLHLGIISRNLYTYSFLKIVSSVYYIWWWPFGMHSTTGTNPRYLGQHTR